MTPERWKQIKLVVQSALACEAEQRPALLFEACGDDDGLRREVESLLAFQDREEDFIEVSAVEVTARALSDMDAAAVEGKRLGPYKILRELGRGGMGTVYLAARDDDNYRKQVAIKLIKRGMDTDAILRRFRNERQILANLEHPNIARLLDGGTTADRLPYLVMEYIDGQPINEYCDHHNLSVNERLELFRTVCAAVEFAHRNLVIHRDIKPSNILVTEDGIPKLLDFGIAKVLNPEAEPATRATATELRLMTPEYASPEQVRGEAITTVSDVYSLGVLLYELLSGHSPYRFSSRLPHEIARVITEQEAEKPSQSAVDSRLWVTESTAKRNGERNIHTQPATRNPKLLRGDLDNIVLMAMRKDPARRYASASQLSEDIRRHLEGLPVSARPDTFAYRASKFVKRNKVASLAAALILLTLVGGIVATAWEARAAKVQQQRAEAERAKAQQRFNDLRQLTNSFIFEFHDAIANLPGSTAARELVLKRATEYLDSLAQEEQVDPTLQLELAQAYDRLGDAQGNRLVASLGDSESAVRNWQKAMEIRERLVNSAPDNADYLYALTDSYRRVAGAAHLRGDLSSELDYLKKGLSILERIATDNSGWERRSYLASFNITLGGVLLQTGDVPGALEHQRRALQTVLSLVAAENNSARSLRKLTISYDYTADVLEKMNDLAGAIEDRRNALRLREQLSAADPANADLILMIYYSHSNIGDLQLKTGDIGGARQNYLQSESIIQSLIQADPKSMEYRIDAASATTKIGDVLMKEGNTTQALLNYRKALSQREELAREDSMNIAHRSDLGESYVRIGEALTKQDKTSAAVESLGRGVEIYETLVAISPASAEFRSSLADADAACGNAYERSAASARSTDERVAGWRAARDWYQRGLDIFQDLQARGILYPADAAKPDEMARALALLRRFIRLTSIIEGAS